MTKIMISRTFRAVFLLVAFITFVALWSGCGSSEPYLLFHAGVGQRSSLMDIQKLFERENPTRKINFSYKGSGYFLADLERSKKGDLFLPGEEFYLLQAQERGHVLSYNPKTDIAAHFMVVIATPRGNPANIRSIKDFAREGVRIGLGNPKACAIGIWDEKTFKKAGVWEKVQKNSVQSAKCIAEKLTSVQNRIVDATLLWASSAVLALRDVEIIPIEPEYRGFVRLPVAVLKHTTDKETAQKLKQFILSSKGAEVFRSHGYIVDPGPLDDQGFCTDDGKATNRFCEYFIQAARAVKDETLDVSKEQLGPLVGEVIRQRKSIHPGAF